MTEQQTPVTEMESNPPKPHRSGPLRLMVVAVVVGVVAFVALLGHWTTYSYGTYSDTVFELTFQDSAGRPLPGIELRVERDDGQNSFHQPINDYYSGRTPTSDPEGVMSFHCVDQGCCLRRDTYLFFIEVGERSPPQYICRFLLEGREVQRIRFDDLIRSGDYEGSQTRTLRLPTAELVAQWENDGELSDPVPDALFQDIERELDVIRRTIVINE